MTERRFGIVKRYLPDRGFGFVQVLESPQEGKPARVDPSFDRDAFLHVYELEKAQIKSIAYGDTLEFDLLQDNKGIKAINVRLVQ